MRLKSAAAEAGDPMAIPESDVGGNRLVPKSVFQVAPDSERAPAFEPVPTVTVAVMGVAGQGGLVPWMRADLLPPGVPKGSFHAAVQTVVAASTLGAPTRAKASTVKPEKDRSFNEEESNHAHFAKLRRGALAWSWFRDQGARGG